MITPALKEDLLAYICGIIVKRRGVVLEINGLEDHVHVLAGLPPTIAVSEALQKIKGGSSWWVNNHRRIDHHFQWQPGYGAFTVSESLVPKVRKYIRDQEEHHRSQSFETEMAAFVKRHGLSPELSRLLGLNQRGEPDSRPVGRRSSSRRDGRR
jgi:REP element-mobilizing transposase RayT